MSAEPSHTDKPGFRTAFVALAALGWGLSGGIGGVLLTKGWDPSVVSFYRGAVGGLFVLIWLALRPAGGGWAKWKLWCGAVAAGLGIAGNFTFYFISMGEGSVAVAATLLYSAPVFVYVISFLLKLEKATLPKFACIVLVMLGVVMLTRAYRLGEVRMTPLGVAAGLLSGLSYAVFIFGFKYAAPHGSPQAILAIAFAVLTGVLFWPADFEQIRAVIHSPDWRGFVLLGVLGAGISFYLYVVGLRHTSPTFASIAAMAEPVTATLFGVWVLNERLAPPQLLGMAILLITVTMFSVSSNS